MRLTVINIRDAEKYYYLTTEGELFTNHSDIANHVADLMATGDPLAPSLEVNMPPAVGDVILLPFPRAFSPDSENNETPQEHYYRVFGRVFDKPVYSAATDNWHIPGATIFVHSPNDETNTNWGDEAGAEGGL
jgi:hypothetical protein